VITITVFGRRVGEERRKGQTRPKEGDTQSIHGNQALQILSNWHPCAPRWEAGASSKMRGWSTSNMCLDASRCYTTGSTIRGTCCQYLAVHVPTLAMLWSKALDVGAIGAGRARELRPGGVS
jgi:hypothetical protein